MYCTVLLKVGNKVESNMGTINISFLIKDIDYIKRGTLLSNMPPHEGPDMGSYRKLISTLEIGQFIISELTQLF